MRRSVNILALVVLAVGFVHADTKPQNKLIKLNQRSIQEGQSQADYDNFFNLIEQLFWSQEDAEGRMYRRGMFNMRRPQFLSRRNGQPASIYRSFVDTCYGGLCALGINGLINRMARLLA